MLKRDTQYPLPSEWNMTEEQLLEMYLLEKQLSERLINESNGEIRRGLYAPIYSEYFSKLPFHPQLQAYKTPQVKERRLHFQEYIILFFLNSDDIFIEIGAGDCELCKRIAANCKKAIAFDVTEKYLGNK